MDEETLSELIRGNVSLRLVEPHIYSLYSPGENTNPYDRMGAVYDLVACNRWYNRIVWGYWTSDYHRMCLEALGSSDEGWVLDAGCGSLAFTAKTYVGSAGRPIVFLDQSMKLLRLAKSRLVKLNGGVPAHMVFLHGDVLQLPFKPKSFRTVIALNVLHVLQDVERVLQQLRNTLSDGGRIYFTTLIENHRVADKYLQALGNAGAVFPRKADQLLAVFDALGMPIRYRIEGNLAFICYG